MRRFDVVWHGNCLRGGHYTFLRRCEVNPPDRGKMAALTGSTEVPSANCGEASSTDKEDSSIFRPFVPSFISVFPHIPIPNFRISFLLINDLILTADTLGGWEFNLNCNSAFHRVRFCVWFSAVSAPQLLEIRVSFTAHMEAIRAFMWHLSWEFKSLSSSFCSPTLSNNMKPNQPISLD